MQTATRNAPKEFVISGLPAEPYLHLYGMSDKELETNGAKQYICDKKPEYPYRIEMRDAEIGKKLILINHVSMQKNTPYRDSHAVFIREGAKQ